MPDVPYTSNRGIWSHQIVAILSENVASTTRVCSGVCTLSAETSLHGRSRHRGNVSSYTATTGTPKLETKQRAGTAVSGTSESNAPAHHGVCAKCSRETSGHRGTRRLRIKHFSTQQPMLAISEERAGTAVPGPKQNHPSRTQRYVRAIGRETSGHGRTRPSAKNARMYNAV